MASTETVTCVFCGPAPTRVLGLLRIPTPEGDLLLRRCRRCGLVFMSPRYTQEALRAMFDDGYFEGGGYSGLHHDRSYFDPAERAEKVAWSHRILDDLERFTAGTRGAILEVGAAGGHFLLAARDRGFEVHGVEISDYAVRRARELYGLDLVRGQLEEASLPTGRYDVVYLNDLLEHTPNPVTFLREVRRVLRPGGLCYAVIPTYVSSLPTKLFAPVWNGKRALRRLAGRPPGPTFLREPFHIYELTAATTRRLFDASGFELVTLESSMPSIQSGFRSNLAGIEQRVKILLMRLYARGVASGLFWGERTRAVARSPRETTGSPSCS